MASINPAAPDARGMRCTGGPGTTAPGSLACQNYSLSYLVMMAYDLRAFQLSAPSWMDTARFDLVAKLPPQTDARRFALMQQALLKQRFGLQAHFEKKEGTVYELTLAKGGSKLKESSVPEGESSDLSWRPPAGGPPSRTMARVVRKSESTTELAMFLSNLLGELVSDATGLSGRYDYELSFMMEPGGRASGPAPSVDAQPDFGASLLDAVREQLGLKLDKKKGQIEVLVIDHAEKAPLGN